MEQLLRKAKEFIPSVNKILDEAWGVLQPECRIARAQFGELLQRIDKKATEIYLSHERKAIEAIAEGWLEEKRHQLQDKRM